MSSFSLPQRKVLVRPIIRQNNWLSKGHSGEFMYDNAKLTICVPLDRNTGMIKDPLTKEEREFFENRNASGLSFEEGSLSIHKKDNKFTGSFNYWHTYEYTILKSDGVIDDSRVFDILDLSNPIDYIKYKVLLANSGPGCMVAPSWDARNDQAEYRIALVDAGYDDVSKATKAETLIAAYAQFNDLSKSQEKMYDFLTIYWLENKKAIMPSPESSTQFLKSQIQKIIEESPETFNILMTSDYEEKLIIHRAIRKGLISREGDIFITVDGKPIGRSLRECILYLRDDRNQEDKLKILALLEDDAATAEIKKTRSKK